MHGQPHIRFNMSRLHLVHIVAAKSSCFWFLRFESTRFVRTCTNVFILSPVRIHSMALTSLLPLRSMWYYEYLSCWPFLSAGSYRVCMIQLPFDYTDLFFIPNPECAVCWVTYYWSFYILMSSAISVLCMTVLWSYFTRNFTLHTSLYQIMIFV